jgi:DNA-binding MarR family transcriptional regulator
MTADEVGKRIMFLHMLRRKYTHNHCFDSALQPGQYPLLNYLLANPGLTQQELAAALHVSPASVAQSTKRMQKVGLVEKRADPDKLRCNRLHVTDAGHATVNAFQEVFSAVDNQMFKGFDEAELELIKNVLDRMIANLTEDEDPAMTWFEEEHRFHDKKAF